jgi:glutamate synthase domain-containing protein 3
MTKGLVLVLGACGRNFAAGMSGGVAYVFDERGDFAEKRCNLDSVDLEPIDLEPISLEPLLETQLTNGEFVEAELVKSLLTRHLELTGSPRAAWLLENWSEAQSRFIKVFPHEHKRVLGVSRRPQPYIPIPLPIVLAAVEQMQHG